MARPGDVVAFKDGLLSADTLQMRASTPWPIGTRARLLVRRTVVALVAGAALLTPLSPAVAVDGPAVGLVPPPPPPTVPGLPTPPADLVVDLTFPAERGGRFSDDYLAARSAGRTHCAGDILGPKHSGIYAAVGGTITFMPTTKPSYGYLLDIQGDDGRRYSYVHLNDDRPGTDDDDDGPEHAYAPGLRKGSRVGRGQLIGYLGDSGNTKGTPHLHFEIHDPAYATAACATGGLSRVNPYRSLRQAMARGDVGSPAVGTGADTDGAAGAATGAVGGARGIELACRPGRVTSAGFTDLGPVHRSGVDCAAWWKVAAGTSATTFDPTGTITRAQLATFVVNVAAGAGRPLPATTVDHFDDDDGSVHEGNIDRVSSTGIMGSATRRFSPKLAVSRGSMATVVARTYRHVAGRALPVGTDAFPSDVGEANRDSINSIAAAGIAVGYADGGFHPALAVTREQMATFFARLLDAFVDGGHTRAR